MFWVVLENIVWGIYEDSYKFVLAIKFQEFMELSKLIRDFEDSSLEFQHKILTSPRTMNCKKKTGPA